jgi:MoaA/NifB/PqqE/SkfB family radical SAM enzyme
MFLNNPKSARVNPFRAVYDNKDFKTVLQHKNKLPDFPYLIDIELTNHCILKCLFCGQQTMKRPKGFMSEKTFKTIVNECAKFNTPIRLIRWGEPFLHPKIVEFVEYAKSRGLLVHITNNGLAIKESQMDKIIEAGLDSLIFSLQGATKKQYELMRNNNRYNELKSNILKMVKKRGSKEKPFIHISSTITNEPEKEIKRFIDYWGRIADSVGIGKTNLSLFNPLQIESQKTIKKLESLKKQENIKKCYLPCTEIYQKLSVDWDGKVTCCCSDFDNFLVVGDINDSTLSEIWRNSQKLKIFRELLDKKMHQSLTLCSTCYKSYDDF